MHLDLTDEETAALIRELHNIVESDKFPFSPRIRTLRAILGKLRPEPVRKPLPPPKVYAPPRAIARKRRRKEIRARTTYDTRRRGRGRRLLDRVVLGLRPPGRTGSRRTRRSLWGRGYCPLSPQRQIGR
jgi:hypothetical protein